MLWRWQRLSSGKDGSAGGIQSSGSPPSRPGAPGCNLKGGHIHTSTVPFLWLPLGPRGLLYSHRCNDLVPPQEGVQNAFHYLDNFLLLGPANHPGYQWVLDITLALCTELGFPIAPEKTNGLASSLVFLGIVIDTVQQQPCLPKEKLEWTLAATGLWEKPLLAIPTLSCSHDGEAFLYSLHNAAASAADLQNWVHLNQVTKVNLAWWHIFLRCWNCTSIMPLTSPLHITRSDASGEWASAGPFTRIIGSNSSGH